MIINVLLIRLASRTHRPAARNDSERRLIHFGGIFAARVCTAARADDIELVQQPQMSNRKVHERSSFRANFRPALKAAGVEER